MNDPSHIYNWRRIGPALTSSGQPSEAQLVEIRDLGVTHVINLGLHTHERALPDEASSVAALDMVYIHIPVDFANPTEEDFSSFVAAIEGLSQTCVHVHCIANMRVTAFLYRYLRDVLGRSEAEARQAMETVWQPGGVWAKFIGDDASVELPHRPPHLQQN